MLLQLAVENYLSFRDRAVLSMLADDRVPHAPGQVMEGPGGRKVLRAAAVYGANGSGKSNLVKALVTVRHW
jgi:AAA15 family ATPase/GTPase